MILSIFAQSLIASQFYQFLVSYVAAGPGETTNIAGTHGVKRIPL